MSKTFTEEERRAYLGGSDAAAALGLSRWKSPLRLWARFVFLRNSEALLHRGFQSEYLPPVLFYWRVVLVDLGGDM